MTFFHDILLTAHFVGLFMGGTTGIGLPIVAKVAATVPVEQKGPFITAIGKMKTVGKIGLVMLIVTGVILAFFGDVWTDAPLWFWLKLVAVAGLIGGIIKADKTGPKAVSGDAEAGALLGKVVHYNHTMLLLIVLFASFAFH